VVGNMLSSVGVKGFVEIDSCHPMIPDDRPDRD